MRHSLLASLMEIAESNARFRERLALYEIGPVYLASEGDPLPEEPLRLAIILSGPRAHRHWSEDSIAAMDFFDIKGILSALFDQLHLGDVKFESSTHPSFHPGKCARIILNDSQIGVLGEIHPLVKEQYDLNLHPCLAAELNLDLIISLASSTATVQSVKTFPPVLEDLAIVVDETISSEQVEQVIREAAGDLLEDLILFDVYRGEQIGAGQKSLAFSLTYQAADRTLTDEEVGKIRQTVIKALEKVLSAQLRA
jgi:phenylalanyl-tRNA synthetase beta chain